MTILSILIPTIPERKVALNRLTSNIISQASACGRLKDIEIHIDDDKRMFDGGKHTGLKRNDLINLATGEYCVFIDDDDLISSSYISKVLWALDSKPDVVTYCGWMTTDGANKVDWEIRLGNPYDAWNNIYRRPPNHIVPIKTSIARQIGYNVNLTAGEDYDYCMRLEKSGLLKTEVHIPELMYHYDYSTYNKSHP